jgi:hypothetical protein
MIEKFINNIIYEPYKSFVRYIPYHSSNNPKSSALSSTEIIIVIFSVYLFVNIIIAYFVYKDTHSVLKTILAFLFGLVIIPFVFVYSNYYGRYNIIYKK